MSTATAGETRELADRREKLDEALERRIRDVTEVFEEAVDLRRRDAMSHDVTDLLELADLTLTAAHNALARYERRSS